LNQHDQQHPHNQLNQQHYNDQHPHYQQRVLSPSFLLYVPTARVGELRWGKPTGNKSTTVLGGAPIWKESLFYYQFLFIPY
jgi:hypothetical protein